MDDSLRDKCWHLTRYVLYQPCTAFSFSKIRRILTVFTAHEPRARRYRRISPSTSQAHENNCTRRRSCSHSYGRNRREAHAWSYYRSWYTHRLAVSRRTTACRPVSETRNKCAWRWTCSHTSGRPWNQQACGQRTTSRIDCTGRRCRRTSARRIPTARVSRWTTSRLPRTRRTTWRRT